MPEADQSWRCTVCGYIHRGPAPPDYCPICGAGASEFEAYADDEPQGPAPGHPTNWRCLDCGYVHEGSEPPEYCPVCGAGRDRFEPIEIPVDGSSASSASVVIVGSGIAGVSAAAAAREVSPDSSITLVSEEPGLPYYRLNLTRYLAGEINETVLPIHPESWYRENNIELIVGEKVREIARDNHEVILDERTVSYDKLVLATGSHPFVPPLHGSELGGVFTLRTRGDADRILDLAGQGGACVCIGGGILGIETAGALAKRGIDVTLLESHEWLMPRQLTMSAGARLEAHLAEAGIALRKSARTSAIEGDDVARAVLLEDGARIECSMVVIATGVRSNTVLARKSGLEVDRGIVVDGYLQTSDPDIFAAGDAAEHNGIVPGSWQVAQFQGSIAGRNAVGARARFGGLPRSNTLKVLGVDLVSIGQFEPPDGSYRVCECSEGDGFYHFVFHDNRLCGAIVIGESSIAAPIKQAIESGKDFSRLLAGMVSGKQVIELLMT